MQAHRAIAAPPSLETSRLILRPFTPQDADAIFAVIGDRDTMRWYPTPYSRADADMWIARSIERYSEDGFGLCAVLLKSTGEFVGDCGLMKQIIERTTDIEVGYHLRRDCWGQGYATEAARRWMQYAFDDLNLARVVSLIRPENVPSARVAQRNGMRIERQVIWADLVHDLWVATNDHRRAASNHK